MCTEKLWSHGGFSQYRCPYRARYDLVDGVATKCGTHSSETKAKAQGQAHLDFSRRAWLVSGPSLVARANQIKMPEGAEVCTACDGVGWTGG